MLLPIRTAPEDIETVCSYLATKPAGVSQADVPCHPLEIAVKLVRRASAADPDQSRPWCLCRLNALALSVFIGEASMIRACLEDALT
jgi:hypothetical protein